MQSLRILPPGANQIGGRSGLAILESSSHHAQATANETEVQAVPADHTLAGNILSLYTFIFVSGGLTQT